MNSNNTPTRINLSSKINNIRTRASALLTIAAVLLAIMLAASVMILIQKLILGLICIFLAFVSFWIARLTPKSLNDTADVLNVLCSRNFTPSTVTKVYADSTSESTQQDAQPQPEQPTPTEKETNKTTKIVKFSLVEKIQNVRERASILLGLAILSLVVQAVVAMIYIAEYTAVGFIYLASAVITYFISRLAPKALQDTADVMAVLAGCNCNQHDDSQTDSATTEDSNVLISATETEEIAKEILVPNSELMYLKLKSIFAQSSLKSPCPTNAEFLEIVDQVIAQGVMETKLNGDQQYVYDKLVAKLKRAKLFLDDKSLEILKACIAKIVK